MFSIVRSAADPLPQRDLQPPVQVVLGGVQMFYALIAMCTYHLQFDELHETVKHDMRAKVELFDGKEPNEKWEDYQTKLIEHLDEEMTEMMKPFEEEMKNLTTKMITPIQGVVSVKIVMYSILLTHFTELQKNWQN